VRLSRQGSQGRRGALGEQGNEVGKARGEGVARVDGWPARMRNCEPRVSPDRVFGMPERALCIIDGPRNGA
jgi:hypothetical protein